MGKQLKKGEKEGEKKEKRRQRRKKEGKNFIMLQQGTQPREH
jgi:hypothetical protein